MFTTLKIDELGKELDVFVKVKKFKTQTDGKFTIVMMSEIDLQSKTPSGAFVMLKINNTQNEMPIHNVDDEEDLNISMITSSALEELKESNILMAS